jgi:hypothetical protein
LHPLSLAKPPSLIALACLWLCPAAGLSADASPARVWEKRELTFTAERPYANPYTEAVVWVDLNGPGFRKRVYGFWDGGRTFRVRLMATAPGRWTWTSGSDPADPGLSGAEGSFTAIPWTESELEENPLRRGMIRATANGHALEFPDGTPYLAIGDTWYATASNRFKWYDDDAGASDRAGRGLQGLRAFPQIPGFQLDQHHSGVSQLEDGRQSVAPDHGRPREDHDSLRLARIWNGQRQEHGQRGWPAVLLPGKAPGHGMDFPDMDRINPEYFRYLDRKIDYLNANGFVPFIEASRRDSGLCWHKYYSWPESYARYIQYVWSRYQANIAVLSPVHLDIIDETVSPADYTDAIDRAEGRFGKPPFGTLLSANANPSTLENWGQPSWVTLHQIGNMREHDNYWYLTEIYGLNPPVPALNGEPYYAGYRDARGPGSANYTRGAVGGTERDNEFCRSGLYGSFLSGGLAGHVYGAEGIWGADIEPSAPTKMWDAFRWGSGAQMQYLRTFALLYRPKRYEELVPMADLVSPNKTRDTLGYEGWAYCARTPDRAVFLALL